MHPWPQIAALVVGCLALALVWTAAILVAHALLGVDDKTSSLGRPERRRLGRTGARGGDPRPAAAGSPPDLDQSLTIRKSDSYRKPEEWSKTRQEQ